MISLVIQYSKISVNMPKELLKEFDRVCELHSYSRAEGIKESVRQFIVDQMPDEYYSPQMKQVMHEAIREQSKELMIGMAQAASDPEIQKIQLETARRASSLGMMDGIEQRAMDQGMPLSEEQKFQVAEQLKIAQLKTREIQNKTREIKEKTRKKI